MSDSVNIAIISGVTGQDGILLSKILQDCKYNVIGLTRSIKNAKSKQLDGKTLRDVTFIETDYHVNSILKILEDYNPQLIFNLAGQSYVSKSWEIIEETIWSQGGITGNFLEAIRRLGDKSIKFINASSSEIFDSKLSPPYSEKSSRNPYNPYGCAQILSTQLVEVFRERYSLNACNAIFFPHESIYRQDNFFFKKVILGVKKISIGESEILEVGNIEIIRDWGYAEEYMEGVYKLSQLDSLLDVCFATNKPQSVRQILEIAFSFKGLDWIDYVVIDEKFHRYYEPEVVYGFASAAEKLLGWRPKLWGKSLVEKVFTDLDSSWK